MVTTALSIRNFWIYRLLLLTMVCLVLILSSCETLGVLPINTAISFSQPSLSLTQSPVVAPSPLPSLITNGTLAYLKWPLGGEKGILRLVNVENLQTQDIIFDCYYCHAFSFSPDGIHIVFTGVKEFSSHMSDEILLLDIKSGAIVQVTKSLSNCGRNVSWSPDGKQLLYTTYECKTLKSDIEVIELATNAIRKLTNTIGREFELRWSPDGKYIAYGYQKREEGENKLVDANLWLMDADGNAPHQISDMLIGSQISWSPDSTHIVFSSPMQCGDIYIADIRTNEAEKLFDTTDCASKPTWSPDGKAIAFLVETIEPTANQTINWQINLMSVDGKDVVSIVHSKQGEATPLYLEWVPVSP